MFSRDRQKRIHMPVSNGKNEKGMHLHTLVNYFSFSSSFQQLMGKLQYFRCTKTVLYANAARAVVEKI